MSLGYLDEQPTRSEIDATTGIVALEFGANWCGICAGAKSLIDGVLDPADDVTRIKAADGKGVPLGRSFGVKLWPTIVLLRDGEEVARVVRPNRPEQVVDALEAARAA